MLYLAGVALPARDSAAPVQDSLYLREREVVALDLGRVMGSLEPGSLSQRVDASDATGLPLATFPPACPWAARQILDEDFWLEEHSPYDSC